MSESSIGEQSNLHFGEVKIKACSSIGSSLRCAKRAVVIDGFKGLTGRRGKEGYRERNRKGKGEGRGNYYQWAN